MSKARNYEKFCEAITAMATILVTDWKDGPVPEVVFDVYWKILKERFTDEQIEAGCRRAMWTQTFFPKPKELIDCIEGGDPAGRAILAFRKAMQAREDVGPWDSIVIDAPIAETIDLMGGWEAFCERTDHELRFLERDFFSIYKIMEERYGHQASPLRLAGTVERDNSARGFLEYIPEAVDYTQGRKRARVAMIGEGGRDDGKGSLLKETMAETQESATYGEAVEEEE